MTRKQVVYRADKLGHVAILALVAHTFGFPLLYSLLTAGLAYWVVSVALVLWRKQPIRGDDKVRDLMLAVVPGLLFVQPYPALALGVVALLAPIDN